MVVKDQSQISLELPASNNGMSSQESTAEQIVSDPTLVHVLVRFLSGCSTSGNSQHSSQVGPTATQAMHEFLSRLQVHLSSSCPQMFSEFLLKLMHILSTERYAINSRERYFQSFNICMLRHNHQSNNDLL